MGKEDIRTTYISHAFRDARKELRTGKNMHLFFHVAALVHFGFIPLKTGLNIVGGILRLIVNNLDRNSTR